MIELLPIFTSRLHLRRFSLSDLDAFQRYRCDPELAKYQGWEPMTREQAVDFLIQQSDQAFVPGGQWLQVAVTCINTGQLIGDFGVCVADEQRGIAHLGFTISRGFQQQGYGSEAVLGILPRLFSSERINVVVAITDTRNDAAIALLRGCSFRLAGTSEAKFRGERCREHRFELTKTHWVDQQAR